MFKILFVYFVLHAHSGTGIGNGGDPLFQFLESTRYSLRLTLSKWQSTSATDVCSVVTELTAEQQKDCSEFAQTEIAAIQTLNVPQAPTDFVLREEPIFVEGPDGQPMPVKAQTALGPGGPVEFHEPSVQFLSPGEILLLMAHEFGHKVYFHGQIVTDNDPILHFVRGRALLDAFGEAVSKWAATYGLIGTSFGLRDVFACQVQAPAGTLKMRVSTARRFLGKDYDSYRVSLGLFPSDPQIEVPEADGTSLRLQLVVEESKDRHTTMEILRELPKDQIESVTKQYLEGYNPITDTAAPRLTIAGGGVQFTCHYVSSEGSSQR